MCQHRHAKILIGLLLSLLFLSGCATETLPRFVSPPPPDKPRLEWVGVYYSEADFAKTSSQEMLAKVLGEKGQYGFKTPFGIVSNGQGIVYVSDIHAKNVRIYDFNQKTVEYLTKMPVMQIPLGLALDSAGNLYIADAGVDKILVYSPDHKPLRAIGGDKEILTKPAYVKVNDKLGRIYVSDSLGHRIVVFDLQGKHLFSFGQVGKEPGQFFSPQGLAFGPDGNLYVADMLNARVQVLTPDGKFIRMFGERGDQPGQLESPKDLAFDSDGNLYLVDSRRSDLVTYTPEGQLLLVTGSQRPTTNVFGFSTPKSICIDKTDRIYVAEALGKRFSVWQYLSKAYLAKHPYTDQDRQKLQEYMEKVKAKQ